MRNHNTHDCWYNARHSGIACHSVHYDEAGHIQYNPITPKLPENSTTYMHSRETLAEISNSVDISAKGSDIGSININSAPVSQYHHKTVKNVQRYIMETLPYSSLRKEYISAA